jgi:metal-responsive CopG/Arc/MetJ family transcriptional regulator
MSIRYGTMGKNWEQGKMIRINVALEDELEQALQEIVVRSNLTQEEIVKRALQQYITFYFEEDDPLIGLFDLGDPHYAEKSKELLRASIQPHSGWTGKQ